MKKPLAILLRMLPLLIGGLVVWYLFAHVVQWDDTPLNGILKERVVTSADGAQEAGHLIITSDGQDHLVPFRPGSPLPQAEVGSAITVDRPGLSSLLVGIDVVYYWLVAAVTLFAFVIQGLRLSVLMATLGHPAQMLTCQRAFFVGLFYSNVIPGGQFGGDPIKAWILSRSSNLPHAIAATVMDRAIGTVALALMAMAAVGIAGDAFSSEVRLVAFGLLGSVVAGFGFVFLLPGLSRRMGVDQLVGVLPSKIRHSRLAGAVVAFRGRTRAILVCLGLSVLAQLGLISAVVLAGAAIHLPLELSRYFALVPVANAIALIPGFPGGWGVGELAFVNLFAVVGVGSAAALVLSSLPRLAFTFVSLVGLPMTLASSFRNATKAIERESAEAATDGELG